ncbi:MAG TPA: hypothetical protein VJ925_12975 [Longimicrobiales bacterium]|nr:hypothetical protein [Longimicrobiales bacterium]
MTALRGTIASVALIGAVVAVAWAGSNLGNAGGDSTNADNDSTDAAAFGVPPGESLTATSTSVSTPAAARPRTPDPEPVGDVRNDGAGAEMVIHVEGHRDVEEDRRIFLPLESVFVLPDDSVTVTVEGVASDAVDLDADGTVDDRRTGRWIWHPSFSAGYADLSLTHGPNDREYIIRAWRLEPRATIRDGRIAGYRVGRYPTSPLGGNPIYLPPPGLVRVTDQNRDVRVSPRFRIGQFTSKQSSSFPTYLILRSQLLLKLEVLLDEMIERGYPASSFHVMSGYRTPYYNVGVLGNARYSRHQWGGAADVFVDEAPKNGYMDDLNGDGDIGLEDIRLITEVVDSLERELETYPIGGAGVYRANTVRGPFVHLDVRGTRARW